MNLLTDIILDVAQNYNIELADDELMALQTECFRDIIRQVAFKKNVKMWEMDFPWLEKKRDPVEVV